jgi:hypothetical protein
LIIVGTGLHFAVAERAKKPLHIFRERLMFVLWIGFTIFSVVLVGLGFDVIAYSLIILMTTGAPSASLPLMDSPLLLKAGMVPFFLPFAAIGLGSVCTVIALKWRKIGVDRYHFSELDSPLAEGEGDDAPSLVLKELIREVENSSGLHRTDARAKAGKWLMDHGSVLDEEDIELAKTSFGYLLPAEWGETPSPEEAKRLESPRIF